jgi:copper chaperone CopZ
MKIRTLIAIPIVLISVAAGFSAEAPEGDVQVRVKGMVCSFCAQGLDKKFRAVPAVEDVKVTLSDKIIRLKLKSGEALADDTIKKIVKDAGYNVESIQR